MGKIPHQEWIEFITGEEYDDVPFTYAALDEEQVPEFGEYLLQEMQDVLEDEFERACYEEYLKQQEVDEAQDSRDACL